MLPNAFSRVENTKDLSVNINISGSRFKYVENTRIIDLPVHINIPRFRFKQVQGARILEMSAHISILRYVC